MTSNLGSQMIQEMFVDSAGGDDSAESYTQMKAAVMGVVQAHFRPEFINRLDDIVVFHPLDKAQIREIARIQLKGLEKRLGERGLRIELEDAALQLLGNVGFDPVYGARPLKRAIQQQLEKRRPRRRSCQRLTSGDTIHVDADTGNWCSAPAEAKRGAACTQAAQPGGAPRAWDRRRRAASPDRAGWCRRR
jgi:ATP-dependent Clp protease ATP-binding subunit ClpB